MTSRARPVVTRCPRPSTSHENEKRVGLLDQRPGSQITWCPERRRPGGARLCGLAGAELRTGSVNDAVASVSPANPAVYPHNRTGPGPAGSDEGDREFPGRVAFGLHVPRQHRAARRWSQLPGGRLSCRARRHRARPEQFDIEVGDVWVVGGSRFLPFVVRLSGCPATAEDGPDSCRRTRRRPRSARWPSRMQRRRWP